MPKKKIEIEAPRKRGPRVPRTSNEGEFMTLADIIKSRVKGMKRTIHPRSFYEVL